MRRFTPIELAIGASLLGSLAAIAIPAFVRELHASRFSEPVDALARMSTAAVQYAEQTHKLPDSAPLTPPAPARGKREAFPAEIWNHPTWQALSFQAAPSGTPFAYAYARYLCRDKRSGVACCGGAKLELGIVTRNVIANVPVIQRVQVCSGGLSGLRAP